VGDEEPPLIKVSLYKIEVLYRWQRKK